MPGYPVALAIVDWVGAGRLGIVVLNSLLGAAAVLAVLLIARETFGDHYRLRRATGLAVAVYPPLVTYSSLALSENLSIAALSWFCYIAFFQPMPVRRRWHWLLSLLLAGTVVTLSRSEGAVVVIVGALVAGRLRHLPRSFAVVTLLVALIAPLGWAARNDIAVHRVELSDSAYLDSTLLLSFNDGNQDAPLYRRGSAVGMGSSNSARSAYQHSVVAYVRNALEQRATSVIAYKVKSLANFPFIPFVWTRSATSSFSALVQHLTAHDMIQIFWSVILLVQYLLAIIGFAKWWRDRQYRYVAGLLLYPIIAFGLAVPFHAQLRLWFGAAVLLVIPAAEGARTICGARTDARARQAGARSVVGHDPGDGF